MKNDYVIIFVTCGSQKEANIITEALLRKRLVACGSIAGAVMSRFWWKGKVDKASEVLVLLKTMRKNFPKVEREVKRLHGYEVPEIIALPIATGSASYLRWIRDTVAQESI